MDALKDRTMDAPLFGLRNHSTRISKKVARLFACRSIEALSVYNEALSSQPEMKTMTVQADVTAERILKLEVPCDVPPGRVEVVLTIQPQHPLPSAGTIDWGHLFGLGREVWQAINAMSYLRDLRADRERGT